MSALHSVRVIRRPGPAQYRAQARRQLARVERLREVVVGADLETDDPVEFLAPRGQHEHRNRRERPDPSQRLETVQHGHRDVQYDHVVRVAGWPSHLVDPGLAVVHGGDDETFRRQVLVEHFAELPVIIDQQHPGALGRRFGGNGGHGFCSFTDCRSIGAVMQPGFALLCNSCRRLGAT